MLGLIFDRPATDPIDVLCLGAHSDDIEIGCGGALLRLLAEHAQVRLHWVVFSGGERREAEARASAAAYTQLATTHTVVVKGFRDGYFPYPGVDVKDYFEELGRSVKPDVIFTHWRRDAHQDHRTLAELTWNTFRDHLVLEYEIPKYDGDLGNPNVFVPLSEAQCRQKVQNLFTAFPSQRDKRWFSESTFLGLMRLRGVECASPTGYAEAFHGRKLVLGRQAR